ncbi:MAG: metallophosphoesterase family protein [Rhodobacterales bacterium]|nr:metallophosphoesterase family protein [Rhodobacterales bacterium]
MKVAVLTDIHANREAFQAVLDAATAHGAERFVLLGDLVGYGPDPEWCCETAEALAAKGAVLVRGNHDNAASGAFEAMSSLAARAMDWTRARLPDAHRAFLGSLPMTVAEGDMLFVHASASHPDSWSYVTSDTRAAPSFRATEARLILCGHTHVPLLANADGAGMVREQAFRQNLPIPLLRSRRWLAVVGAVGQPRDGVAQAGWAMLDLAKNELTFRRTAYDCGQTAARIRALGLPEELALRLLKGT